MKKKSNGGKGRHPRIASRTELRKIIAFKKEHKLTDAQVAKHFGFSPNTLYNTINRYKEA